MDLSHQKRYKVFMDESYAHETEDGKRSEQWRYYELRGKFGMIYPWSHDWLGVQVKAGIMGNRVRRAHPDWKVIQDASDLTVFKVPNALIDEVAGIIHAKRKKVVSEEELKRLQMMSKKHSPFRKKASMGVTSG